MRLLKYSFLEHSSTQNNIIMIFYKGSLGNYVPSGGKIKNTPSLAGILSARPLLKNAFLLYILTSEIHKENLHNFISISGLTL